MKLKFTLLIGGFVLFFSFLAGISIQKAEASSIEFEPVVLEEDSLVEPAAELLKYWHVTDLFFKYDPPPVTYHETTIYGTRMGGYLEYVGPIQSGGAFFRYQGYLYNLKYPIPSTKATKSQ